MKHTSPSTQNSMPSNEEIMGHIQKAFEDSTLQTEGVIVLMKHRDTEGQPRLTRMLFGPVSPLAELMTAATIHCLNSMEGYAEIAASIMDTYIAIRQREEQEVLH